MSLRPVPSGPPWDSQQTGTGRVPDPEGLLFSGQSMPWQAVFSMVVQYVSPIPSEALTGRMVQTSPVYLVLNVESALGLWRTEILEGQKWLKH